MLLAAKFISSCGCNSFSIQTFDSDVAIFALYYPPMLPKPLFMKTRAGKMKEY